MRTIAAESFAQIVTGASLSSSRLISDYTIAALMVLFVLTGQVPPILLVTLLAMCYLAGYELWKEKDLQFLWKAWWVLFVFLLNVVGFGIFWLWLAVRRWRHA